METQLVGSFQRMRARPEADTREIKRVVVTMRDMLKIGAIVKKGATLASVAAELKVGKLSVHDIVRYQDKLQTFYMKVQDSDKIKRRRIIRRDHSDQLSRTTIAFVRRTQVARASRHGWGDLKGSIDGRPDTHTTSLLRASQSPSPLFNTKHPPACTSIPQHTS